MRLLTCLLLTSCSMPTSGPSLDAGVPTDPDAALDAPDALGPPPDAAPPLDPSTPWIRHTIHAGLQGADGHALADLDGDGDLDAVAAWEESAQITVSLQPTDPRTPWPTYTLYTHRGAEDVALGDVDGDGVLDVASAGQDLRLRVAFGIGDGSFETPVELTAATGAQMWMQVAIAHGTIYAGGRVAAPAQIVALTPGADPRDGTAWSLTPLGPTGWTMSLLPQDVDGDGDLDLLISDRQWAAPAVPGGPRDYSVMGSRWLERTGALDAPWTNHPISAPAGGGRTARFLAYHAGPGAPFVVEGYSEDAPGVAATVRTVGLTAGSPGPTTALPWPDSLGAYQAAAVADVDDDGRLDVVATAAAAEGALAGVVLLRATDTGWATYALGGPDGTKFDEVDVVDVDRDGRLDVVTTEQIDGLGLVWYERP